MHSIDYALTPPGEIGTPQHRQPAGPGMAYAIHLADHWLEFEPVGQDVRVTVRPWKPGVDGLGVFRGYPRSRTMRVEAARRLWRRLLPWREYR